LGNAARLRRGRLEALSSAIVLPRAGFLAILRYQKLEAAPASPHATIGRLTSDPDASKAYVLLQESSTSELKPAGNNSDVGRSIGLGIIELLLVVAG